MIAHVRPEIYIKPFFKRGWFTITSQDAGFDKGDARVRRKSRHLADHRARRNTTDFFDQPARVEQFLFRLGWKSAHEVIGAADTAVVDFAHNVADHVERDVLLHEIEHAVRARLDTEREKRTTAPPKQIDKRGRIPGEIVYTATRRPFDVKAGVDYLLGKPFDAAAVREKVVLAKHDTIQIEPFDQFCEAVERGVRVETPPSAAMNRLNVTEGASVGTPSG